MSTTPMIAPDGSGWDIPSAKVPDAIKSGGKIAAPVLGPDGNKWLIPTDQVRAALAKGGQLIGSDPKVPAVNMQQSNVPFTHQETDQEQALRQQNEQQVARNYGKSFGLMTGGGLQDVSKAATAAGQPIGQRVIDAIKQRFRPTPPPVEAELSPAQAAEGETWREPEAAPNEAAPQTPQTPRARPQPRFSDADKAAATRLLQDATSHVIDEAVPVNTGANAIAKARVNHFLAQGDVANAEAALQQAAKQGNSAWQPLERRPVPSVDEIRARLKAGPGSPPDLTDDHALQQEMNWDLQRHGWSAESEARREFIARNSTGMTKGELASRFAANSGKGVPAAAAAMPDDLTAILQKSLEAVQAKKLAR